ncbi:MAG: hypothetical protein JWQ97_3381 [Phenylobacterium sp.]|nr:hypothetical protein [Phenylobacterium sp.]
MNAKAQPLTAAEVVEPGAEVAIIPRETALSVLTDPEQFDAFYSKVKAEVDAHVPDVSCAKGREAIKSLAFKVVKSKTAIDAAGKALTEEWRSQTAKVDASRKAIRDKLDELRDQVRRPVTELEEAEEARVADVKAQLARLQSAAVVSIEDTVDTVAARLTQIEAVEISDEYFQEYAAAARSHQQTSVATLEAAMGRLQREVAERADLERLRREDQERQEREAADRAAAEAREREEAEARSAEERRQQAEREAQEASARRAEEAAATARAEAERHAEETRAAQERAHQEELAEARRQQEAAAAEARRLADEDAARLKREADERAAADARAADVAHRSTVMAAAKVALMATGGIGEEAAKKIVLAIRAGEIPAVTLTF